MPRIRCAYDGCLYLEVDFCGAEEIDLDPEEGCLTFVQIEDLALEDEDWEGVLFGEDEDEGSHHDEDDDDDGYDPSEWN